MHEEHQITAFQNAFDFILAGNATFTLVSEKTGTRYTYKVQASKDDEGRRSKQKGGVHFVSLLTGSNNEDDYTYLGIIRDNDFRRTAKSKISGQAPGFKAFAWFWAQLLKLGALPQHVQIWHQGRCGACGRALTVPESIATGLGPECSSRLGVARAVLSTELEDAIAARRGAHPDEIAMQRMEAQGDLEQTIRDEKAKHEARALMEEV